MRLTVASYNIQYGLGQDGRTDLQRIVDTVADADIILLQEVGQYWTRDDGVDQVADLTDRLNRHVVYGSGLDVDASTVQDGRVINRRKTFGNLVASRWPILSSRTQLLPKPALPEVRDIQRCVVEAVIDAPNGGLRAYSVHMSHVSPGQRLPQVAALHDFVARARVDGRPFDGMPAPDWAPDLPPMTMPAAALVGGDFNCTPDSPEYAVLCGELDPHRGRLRRADQLIDTYAAAGHDPFAASTHHGAETRYKIDHLLASPDVASRVTASWIGDAVGSDHYPVFVELDWAASTV